ncbi:MAG: carboxypeptidase-like regulatory domain-containing protein, partial [Bacteroidales bacterium]
MNQSRLTNRANRIASVGIILFLLFGTMVSLYSQGFTVEGHVRDAADGQPVPLVTVYLNGTTLGTISGPDGKFRISHVILPCELILSHVSYHLERIPLRDSSGLIGLVIKLEKRVIELEEASVFHTSPEENEEVLKRFKRWFLGLNYAETGAEILNDSVIRFIQRENDQFFAEAFAPIKVSVPATGYLIMVDLVHFYLKYREESEDYHCSILGYYYFEPMTPDTRREERWRARKRADAYFNSANHFCKSLYHNQLLENGYLFERACEVDPPKGRAPVQVPDFIADYSSDPFGNPRLMLSRFTCHDYRVKYSYRAGDKPADLT